MRMLLSRAVIHFQVSAWCSDVEMDSMISASRGAMLHSKSSEKCRASQASRAKRMARLFSYGKIIVDIEELFHFTAFTKKHNFAAAAGFHRPETHGPRRRSLCIFIQGPEYLLS